jgi:hypothetical protein
VAFAGAGALAACGGQVVVDGGGAGGAGGDAAVTTSSVSPAGQTVSTSVGPGPSTVTVSVGPSTTVTTGPDPGDCQTCGEFITDISPGVSICPGTSTELYQAVFDCVCGAQCPTECVGICQGGDDPGSECEACATSLCGAQLAACANDF